MFSVHILLLVSQYVFSLDFLALMKIFSLASLFFFFSSTPEKENRVLMGRPLFTFVGPHNGGFPPRNKSSRTVVKPKSVSMRLCRFPHRLFKNLQQTKHKNSHIKINILLLVGISSKQFILLTQNIHFFCNFSSLQK